MAGNVQYTNDDRGLTLEVEVHPNGYTSGVVEVVQGRGVKVSSPDGKVFLFVKGDVEWSVLTSEGVETGTTTD